ncbi:MAG: penicillin acylase family protein [Pyrinomonadaceae bacterium]
MNRKIPFLTLLLLAISWLPLFAAERTAAVENLPPAARQTDEMARWRAIADRVTIVRDDWGIPHIYGKTDADVVFGMMYAQAEDDFARIEMNYLTSLGRVAEAEGERRIWQDLRQRLFIDPVELKKLYGRSPAMLRRLMDAWADGLNFYLATHPEVRPKVITRFEPWMALSFTEGSIGGDIETISLARLAEFYGDKAARPEPEEDLGEGEDPATREFPGSNGIAIAPFNTTGRRSLLLINPHTSFYFRAEQQGVSEEGMNVYGALTWGQFFVYQGFNDRLGWMHTSSNVDVIDEFAERIVRRGGKLYYRFGKRLRPVETRSISLKYKDANGRTATRTFNIYRTHHGPIVRAADGRWISVALMNRPIEALSQSYLRTKARSLAEFRRTLDRYKANSSNNTVYADADGNIAYFHPQYIPRRDDRFDWTKPVDGGDPATEYKGLHTMDEAPHVINPQTGWIQNTNNWPYSAAGARFSPRRADFPKYMDTSGENSRGLHAIRVLDGRRDFTLDRLVAAAFDPYLPTFAEIVPPLVRAYDALPEGDPMWSRLREPIGVLRAWDFTWGASSVPTSLAVYYGQALSRQMQSRGVPVGFFFTSQIEAVKRDATPADMLASLAAAVERLTQDFGTWRVGWGEINRFQRLTGDIEQKFDDSKPSIPVPFTSGTWGSLASFGARTYPGTKRMYGSSGNSFVAVVEFGPRVRARAVTAGGESGDPRSPHFNDQAERYASGSLREVYFYREELKGRTERTYRPGRPANDLSAIGERGR